MEDALRLDGVQFADESVMGVDEPGAVDSMRYMDDAHMMMDTGADEIVGLDMEQEYCVERVAGADMPALGGEEEVLTLHTYLSSADAAPSYEQEQHNAQAEMECEGEGLDLEELVASTLQSPVKASAPPPPASSAPPAPTPTPTFIQLQPNPAPLKLAPAPAPVRREVAIAPKPAPERRMLQEAGKTWQAPKLVPISKGHVVKKLAIGGLVQGKAPTVIGTLAAGSTGKQLVMVGGVGGAGAAGARLKLVSASSAANAGPTPVHYIKTQQGKQVVIPAARKGATNNPLLTKMLVQGTGVEGQSVVAQLVPSSTQSAGRVYTLYPDGTVSGNVKSVGQQQQQQIVRVKPRQQQMVSLKSPHKLVSVPAHGAATTKKVVISGGGVARQSVVLKSAGNTHLGGQIHQINVPGKGVQYIRLVSTPSSVGGRAPAKVTSGTSTLLTLPSNTLLLPDAAAGAKQVVKTQQKLVRIAPVTKSSPHSLLVTSSARGATRPAQSLLAPRAVAPPAAATKQEPEDSKEQLRELISDFTHIQIPIEYDKKTQAQDDGRGDTEEQTIVCEEEIPAEEVEQQTVSEEQYQRITVPSFLQRQLQHQAPISQALTYQEEEEGEDETSLQAAHYQPLSAHYQLDHNYQDNNNGAESGVRPRKACNCTKSQCLKLYCDCFANGEFCNQCNCNNCHNNLDNEELRQKAIRSCLERNPNAFRPKIGKGKSAVGPEPVRRHNKGCNCKRSGCLKNYCECYEAKIACSAICRCVGCRNVEDGAERARRKEPWKEELQSLSSLADLRPPPLSPHFKQPCSFMTSEVIEAVCQCLLAAAAVDDERADAKVPAVLEEFSRCLQDIIGAAHHTQSEPSQT